MHINELSPEDFVFILQRGGLTLGECIHVREVCTHWRDTIERQLCSSKRTLQLFITKDQYEVWNCGASGQEMIEQQVLLHGQAQTSKQQRLDLLNLRGYLVLAPECHGSALVRFLARLFPAVEHLIVYFDGWTIIDLPYLFEKWSSQLKSVSLFGRMPRGAQYVERILEALNSLPVLDSLFLFSQSTLPRKEVPERALTQSSAVVQQKVNDELQNAVKLLPNMSRFVAFFPSLNSLTVSIENWAALTSICTQFSPSLHSVVIFCDNLVI